MVDPSGDPRDDRGADGFDREVNYRAVFGFLVGIVLLTIGAFVAMWYLGIGMRGSLRRSDVPPSPIAEARAPHVPPSPHLQVHPYADLMDLRAHEDEILNSYGWVDRSENMVRIPIEEAMRRMAEAQARPQVENGPEPSAHGAPPTSGSESSR